MTIVSHRRGLGAEVRNQKSEGEKDRGLRSEIRVQKAKREERKRTGKMSEILLLCAENPNKLKERVDDLIPRVARLRSEELIRLAK